MVKTKNKTNKTASIAIASSLLPAIGYMIKLLGVGRIEQIDFLVYVSSIVLSAVFFYRLIFKKTMLSTHRIFGFQSNFFYGTLSLLNLIFVITIQAVNRYNLWGWYVLFFVVICIILFPVKDAT
jgi:hypothetical protein